MPIGISIREKNALSPDRTYSMIPDQMLTDNNDAGAKSARLYENSAWCAPASTDGEYIQVYLLKVDH